MALAATSFAGHANTNDPPAYPRSVTNIVEAQIALTRLAISCGSIDGLMGPQTRSALQAFQKEQGLRPSGELDLVTRTNLILQSNAFALYFIKTEDLARVQPLSDTWVGKSKQTALDYTNLLELVAEKTKAHPALLKQLNPRVAWESLKALDTVNVPSAHYPPAPGKAALIRISLGQRTLEAFDAEDNLLAHFPCSIARMAEKRPVGELHVNVVAPNPNYTFDPALFAESPEARTLTSKLVLPPGPNNPVGSVWIGLDRPGYGIHGTPNPEQVGRTESHGCFRLANWNAEYLLTLVSLGTPITVEP
jgi:lipoprotein-anchoring transpeptidase ErfK/SrfK